MPEFGSQSEIERFVRKRIQETSDSAWTVRRRGDGTTLFEDEETERLTISGRYRD
jgi:hypothetical protein